MESSIVSLGSSTPNWIPKKRPEWQKKRFFDSHNLTFSQCLQLRYLVRLLTWWNEVWGLPKEYRSAFWYLFARVQSSWYVFSKDKQVRWQIKGNRTESYFRERSSNVIHFGIVSSVKNVMLWYSKSLSFRSISNANVRVGI